MEDAPEHPLGDVVARMDQVLAEFRGVASLTTEYLAFLENENVPQDFARELVRDWHREFWRAAMSDVGPSAARRDS